ncbi:MAG TPA: DUF1570 domain-containing protein [Isosphaeraceae bacterium]|jgi:hypothetical protein
MGLSAWVLVIGVVAQIPPPETAAERSAPLRQESREIRRREAERLAAAADALAARGRAEEAETVRGWIEPEPDPDGPTRFVPLPEFVAASDPGLANVPARAIREATAEAWYELAERALQANQLALADECLRRVVGRRPDHAEARRLLGYVPRAGGWATPFAVRMLREGQVQHPKFGWVPAAWIPHLEQGELPAPAEPGRPRRWLPAAEADALRRDVANAWDLVTPHFRIRANVPLAEAITFGRRLEDFHEAFLALLADVIGPERHPLAQRFRKPAATAVREPEPHRVWYFAARDQYIDFLTRRGVPDVQAELGRYLPPKESRQLKIPPASYFFLDPTNQLGATGTLYHEASHQLLFETAGPTAYERNLGNYWVFEGLGTYFETVTSHPDGSLAIGGRVGPRFETARSRLVDNGEVVPIARLVAQDESAFKGGDVYLHYAQSLALTLFLMQADGGRHRDGFLAYVHDAYRGRARGGPALAHHLGEEYESLEARFLEFLKAGTPLTSRVHAPTRN